MDGKKPFEMVEIVVLPSSTLSDRQRALQVVRATADDGTAWTEAHTPNTSKARRVDLTARVKC